MRDLQHALPGESFLEKERQLSKMILQLQMMRDQLFQRQEPQRKVREPPFYNGQQYVCVDSTTNLLRIVQPLQNCQ